jgi:hypothetical protein
MVRNPRKPKAQVDASICGVGMVLVMVRLTFGPLEAFACELFAQLWHHRGGCVLFFGIGRPYETETLSGLAVINTAQGKGGNRGSWTRCRN